MTEMTAGDDCPDCGHPFDPHILVATGASALDGGLMFCQDRECGCASTWSVQGRPRPAMPPLHIVDQVRAAAFS